MTDFDDPPRLADSSAADSRLGSLFRVAREQLPTDRQLADLEAKLGSVLGPGSAVPVAPKALLLAKLGAGAALLVLGVGGLFYARSRPTAGAHRGVPSGEDRLALPPPAPPATPTEASAASVPHKLAEPVLSAPIPSASGSVHRVPASARPDEAALLERARSALGANPARALALTAEHARGFPHGVLAQEREVIAIAALRRLGRAAEAENRAENFDRRYPNSAHQRTVNAEPER